MVNCPGQTVFFLLIAFCILFALVGGGVIGFGVYLLLQTRDYFPVFLTDGYIITTYFLIALGGIIVAISSIGLLGSWCAKSKNNQSLIRFFVFILVNILILELFAVFTSSILQTDIKNDVETNMEKALMGYNDNMTKNRTRLTFVDPLYQWPGPIQKFTTLNSTETLSSTQASPAPNTIDDLISTQAPNTIDDYLISTPTPNSIDDPNDTNTSISIDYKEAWDSLQENFQCCGIYDKDDWMNMINISPPESCYDKKDGNNTYNNIGCLNALIHSSFPVIDIIPSTGNTLLDENIITGLAVFVVSLQLFGILFGLCFGCCYVVSTDSDALSEKTEDDTEFDYEEVEEKIEVDDGTNFE